MAAKLLRSQWFASFAIVFNISVSILIVLINKWLFTVYAFPNVSLTCIHFVITSIGLFICQHVGIFQPKSVPILKMLPLAVTFCGFVVFTNKSLEHNTVGTYQLIKTLTTPGIMCIQTLFYKRTFSTKVKLTVIPISIGVFLNSYYDVKFNETGTVYAILGVIVTALYQVWVAEKQQEFQMNSMQLLMYQAPLSAGLLVIVIPFMEGPFFSYHGALGSFPPMAIVLVFTSGVVAFFVNLTIYWIIGNTSPVTYNMAGHLKFCVTLCIGFLVFDELITQIQVLGILITIGGVFSYTHLKMKEQNQNTLPQQCTVKQSS